MATCCQSDVGRVAVKHCFKLLGFFYIYLVLITDNSMQDTFPKIARTLEI